MNSGATGPTEAAGGGASADASPLPRGEFLLDLSVAFLNHGSFGATPRVVFDDYQAWQRELERQPVEFLLRRFPELLRAARTALARHIGADADHLVFVPNATTALNIVAHSLRLQPGDEVLATNHEYGAMDRMWRLLCTRAGARYRPVEISLPLPSTGAVADAIWAGVTPATRVLFLSHITSPTAVVLPVAELCRRARAAGILSIVDGAHALGHLPLVLGEIGADIYVANAHKWLCAPKGSALLYVRPEHHARIEPLIISWGDTASNATGRPFLDEQQWTGTRDIAAFLAVPAALRFWAGPRETAASEQCHQLARRAQAALLKLTGRPPLCTGQTECPPQMFSISLPPCDAPALQADLYQRHRIEVPVLRWRDETLLRVSVHAYNSWSDVQRLIDALPEALQCHRTPPV